MPKKVKVISRFDGGINTKSHAKDIADNEMSDAQNVYVDQIGTLMSGGVAIANTVDYDTRAGTIVSGYGLYQATFDYNDANDNQSTVKNFITADRAGAPYGQDIYDSEGAGSWTTNIYLAGSANQQIIYHIADGAVRMCDSAFLSSQIRWYGHIKRQQFKGLTTTADDTFDEYILTDNKISAPSYLDTTTAYPSAGVGFNVKIEDGGVDGQWSAGTYDIASSFIYDKDQESLLKVKEGALTLSSDNRIIKGTGIYATSPFPARIVGSRIYIRKELTDDPWVLLFDISIADGVRVKLDAEFDAWSYVSGNNVSVSYTLNDLISPKPNLDTYETINGYSPDEKFVSFDTAGMGYRTSVVTNGRTFVANVKIKNEDGEIETMPDRIMYSQVGKYDIFPTSNYIDIGVNDGDEFIKLEAFADRLFAYKKNKLYIINIGGGGDTQWFLESEYSSLGVKSQNATTKVDLGIIWANENGLYLYDGQRVTNLQDKIKDETWYNFCNGSKLMVGFLPKKKEIVIVKSSDSSASSAGNNDAYIYHMQTKSFVFVNDFLPLNYSFSNMILDSNGKLTVGSSGGFYSYDGSQQDTTVSRATFKYEDLKDTRALKKMYKILVNYTTTAIQEDPFSFKYINSGGTESSGTFTGDMAISTTQKVQSFTFNEGGTPITAQSVEVGFDPVADGQWEINDISLVYRPISKEVA